MRLPPLRRRTSGSRAPVSPHIAQPTTKASLKPAAAALKEDSGIRMSGSLLRSQPHTPDGLKGEDAPCRTHPPRCRAARQAGRTAAPRGFGTVPGSAVHRPSAQSRRPPANAAAPPHRPVRSAHSPVIYFCISLFDNQKLNSIDSISNLFIPLPDH